MYLSTVPHPGGDNHSVHRYLTSREFRDQPSNPDPAAGRLLWYNNGLSILVLSPLEVPGCRDVQPMLDALEQGQQLGYRTRLDACVCRNHRRVARDMLGIADWIDEMFERRGFTATKQIDYESRVPVLKPGQEHRIESVRVSGVLTVTVPADCRYAIMNGIGHSKHAGFGMLDVF